MLVQVLLVPVVHQCVVEVVEPCKTVEAHEEQAQQHPREQPNPDGQQDADQLESPLPHIGTVRVDVPDEVPEGALPNGVEDGAEDTREEARENVVVQVAQTGQDAVLVQSPELAGVVDGGDEAPDEACSQRHRWVSVQVRGTAVDDATLG